MTVDCGGEILVGRNGPLLSTPPLNVERGGEILVGRNGVPFASPPMTVDCGGEILVGRNGPLLSTPPMTVDCGGVRNPCKKTQGQAEADSTLQTTHSFRRIPQPL